MDNLTYYALQGDSEHCLYVRRKGSSLHLSVLEADGRRTCDVVLSSRAQYQQLLRFIIEAMNSKEVKQA